jgi:hypothetical protein
MTSAMPETTPVTEMGIVGPKIDEWTRWLCGASKEDMRRELIRIYSAHNDDIEGDVACKVMSYDEAHMDAAEMGYPSLTEALEHLDELRESALSTRTPEAAQVEITDAMIEAGVRVLDSRSQDGTFRDDVRRIYAAMHDAAIAQVRHPLEKEG